MIWLLEKSLIILVSVVNTFQSYSQALTDFIIIIIMFYMQVLHKITASIMSILLFDDVIFSGCNRLC